MTEKVQPNDIQVLFNAVFHREMTQLDEVKLHVGISLILVFVMQLTSEVPLTGLHAAAYLHVSLIGIVILAVNTAAGAFKLLRVIGGVSE